MANNANYGFESRWAVNPTGTAFSTSSGSRYDFTGSSVRGSSEILDGMGRVGTRMRREDRTRWGLKKVEGTLNLEPTPQNLHFFWLYILGAQSSNSFTVLDSLPGFDLLADDYGTGASAILFSELYVDKATLTFGPGILKMSIDVKGKSWTAAQTYHSASTDVIGAGAGHTPYVFDDSVFTIKGSAREIDSGTLVINNFLDLKFRNSRTAASIRATDREITLVTSIPNTTGNLSAFFGDKAAASATVVLTNGSLSSTVNLFNLKNFDDSPVMNGKDEILLVLNNSARGDSSNPDISVTNVAA